jgi:hypothetical protein
MRAESSICAHTDGLRVQQMFLEKAVQFLVATGEKLLSIQGPADGNRG